MNAPRVPRTRLATSAVNQATFPVTAPTHPPTVVLVVVASLLEVVVLPKSATRYDLLISLKMLRANKFYSAPRLVTLPATALRLVDTAVVDTVVLKVATAVVDSVDAKVDKHATRAVVMDICLVCILSNIPLSNLANKFR